MRRMGQVKIAIKKPSVGQEQQQLQLTFHEFADLSNKTRQLQLETTSLIFASRLSIKLQGKT